MGKKHQGKARLVEEFNKPMDTVDDWNQTQVELTGVKAATQSKVWGPGSTRSIKKTPGTD